VDDRGQVVSMTTTVEFVFGSEVMADGFFLNNQLTDFARGTLSDANSDGVPDTVSSPSTKACAMSTYSETTTRAGSEVRHGARLTVSFKWTRPEWIDSGPTSPPG
jgi:gamma-glutamyltranspeptidase